MFLGSYTIHFTGKGRVVLPRKMREEVKGQGLILSRGLDHCIWGFDKESWQKQAERQLEIPIVDAEGRDLRRYLFSAAEEVDLDGQGRFVIPPQLLQYAQLKDEVVIIGAGDHLEIWDEKAWQETIARLERQTEER